MAHKTFVKHTQGKTAVLFIHGFLGSTEHFEEFIKKVPDECAVYNILLTGHGGSVTDFARASMKKWKTQVNEAVDLLLRKYDDLIICGHSMGTFLAMKEALRNPERIKKLFLLAIPLKISVKPEAAINTFMSFFGIGGKDNRKVQMYQKAHSVKLTFRLWEYIGWIPRYLELFKESKLSREYIKNLDVETHIYMSKKDELVALKSVDFIPQADNISTFILPDSAHFIYSDEDLSRLLKDFGSLFDEK